MPNELSTVDTISQEIKMQLSNVAVSRALIATTFKGLDETKMRQALMEGMIRGFKFQEFLQKDVYAVPYGSGYSLVTSIDYSRKLAMRTGLYAGKSAPMYVLEGTEDGGQRIESCTVTVKKNIGGIFADFTATVFFNEYSTGKNLWLSKPRTMIAKVAEMHALRMAFPEELNKQYIEEEFNKAPTRMGEVVDHAEESVRMGETLKHDQGKNETPAGEGVDEEPDQETIIQIEEKTNAESQ